MGGVAFIIKHQALGIIKDLLGFLKPDAMFFPVEFVFSLIPLKREHAYIIAIWYLEINPDG